MAAAAQAVVTARELQDWPVAVDVPTAGRAFSLGRDLAYQLARDGRFPCPVMRLGKRFVVPTAGIRRALGMDELRSEALAEHTKKLVAASPEGKHAAAQPAGPVAVKPE